MLSLKTTISIFLFSAVLSSCGNNKKNSIQEQIKGESGISYSQSLKTWQKLKKQEGNSYRYSLEESSWTGKISRTTLVVEDGKVVNRFFNAYDRNENTGEEVLTDSYSETSENLGTHEKGAKALTIDELYELCLSDYLLVDEESNTIYFDTRKEGVINLCGYVPDACADDCFQGISISDFVWL